MIWSVSTLLPRNGTARPVWTVNCCIWLVLLLSSTRICGLAGHRRQLSWTSEAAGDCRRSSDVGRDQMSTTPRALPPLEVAVRRRGAALTRCQLIRIHTKAHRAAGEAPVRTCVDE